MQSDLLRKCEYIAAKRRDAVPVAYVLDVLVAAGERARDRRFLAAAIRLAVALQRNLGPRTWEGVSSCDCLVISRVIL